MPSRRARAGRAAIGCGSASAGDRLSSAFDLGASGRVDYLVFDRVGEMSMAGWESRRQRDPAGGWDRALRDVITGLTGYLGAGGVVIGSFGGANVDGATAAAVEVARRQGLTGLTIGAVHGDNVLEVALKEDVHLGELDCPIGAVADRVTSAYAYIGADGIRGALDDGAQVVIGGRLADSSPAVAALADALDLSLDDWPAMAVGTMTGHLLEGGSGITGGGFADPPYRPAVPGYDPLGFPLALASADDVIITKLDRDPGTVTPETVKSRIVYETQDPAAYLTPDVHLDMSQVAVRLVSPDVVEVSGMRGLPRPDTYRVLVTVKVGWKAVAEVSYGGPGCLTRARLGEEILRHRFDAVGARTTKLRFEYQGVSTLFGRADRWPDDPEEVRLRIAALCPTRADAVAICEESALLYFDRPAGMGATSTAVSEAQVAVPTTLDRQAVGIDYEVVTA